MIETPSQKFSSEILKPLHSVVLRDIFISAEEANYTKDYMKARL